MKLVLDEKLKHRLIGLAVIISMGAIFAPAMMKKSSQNLESTISVNVKLPPKPLAPNVVLKNDQELFKTIKVASIKIQPLSEKKQLRALVKAESLKPKSDTTENIVQNTAPHHAELAHVALNAGANHAAKRLITAAAKQSTPKQPVTVALAQKKIIKKPLKNMQAVTSRSARMVQVAANKKVFRTNKPVIMKQAIMKQDRYSVQLASFSQPGNAQTLVNKLRAKGYPANLMKISNAHGGSTYKVFVGNSQRKSDVLRLKNQLASAMQLNGFVVNTGVS